MGKSARMTLTGDKQLEKALRSLGPRVAKKVLRGAVNAAATPVLKTARAKVSEESGLLKKSLGKKVRLNKRTGTASARVGARNTIQGEHDGKPRVPWRYAHLVELGHVDENGRHVPAHPFLRPAADENAEKAVGVMTDKLAAGIVKEAANG
jgi:HK97 gp10 family phage protein